MSCWQRTTVATAIAAAWGLPCRAGGQFVTAAAQPPCSTPCRRCLNRGADLLSAPCVLIHTCRFLFQQAGSLWSATQS